MLRHVAAAFAIALVSLPAHASIASKTERGVRVWRSPASVAAPPLKAASAPACVHETIVIVNAGWPARRLRTHGFWSGEATNFETRLPFTTQGFYADRIAAGD